MPKLFFALLACLAAALAAPAGAQRPASTQAAADQLQALGAWMQRVAEAMTPMNQAAARFGSGMSALQGIPTGPENASRHAAAVRAAVADVRQAVQQSQARLGSIPRFETKIPGVNLDVNRLLTDAKAQTSRMLAYMDDADALAAAVEKRDPAAAQAAGAKLIRGGFLLLDSQVILYRGRQALFAPSRSAHQLLDVPIQLYRAMSAAGDAWFQARIEGKPAEAAQAQKTRFLALADELEASLAQGRANMAREAAELAADRPRAIKDPGMARVIASVERVLATQSKNFAIGDELAAWMRSRADTPGATLAAQPSPDFILELSRFEEELVARMNEAAASLSEGGR